MGLLIDGEWHDRWYDTRASMGRFVRQESRYRNWVTEDGAPGPSGEGGFEAEPGRYHLYVSYACPWAHRTLILRRLKRLEEVISVSVVEPHMLEHGWEFRRPDGSGIDGATEDTVNGARCLYEIYRLADPRYTGRCTVPVLWDRARRTIVNNESADIVRMLNAAFDVFARVRTDYYPPHLRAEIDAVNELVYEHVNNGVYACGFATAQDAYEEAFVKLFETLDALETRLAERRYLAGSELTEADWRLFTTLVRFDAVYYGHFKTNLRRIADYPNLANYLRELYQHEEVADTVDFTHIKQHYYYSHHHINPTRIVPLGPEQSLWAPHDRGRLGRGG